MSAPSSRFFPPDADGPGAHQKTLWTTRASHLRPAALSA